MRLSKRFIYSSHNPHGTFKHCNNNYSNMGADEFDQPVEVKSALTRTYVILKNYGTVNRALDADEIGPFVEALAKRIALWPSESINATKQAVYESIDLSIEEALRAEAY